MRVIRGRGGMRSQASIKSRLGIPEAAEGGASIQSRLGTRGGGVGRGRGGTLSRRGTGVVTAIAKTPITDARQKINLNKVISGRIGDARQSIELKRTKRFSSPVYQLPAGAALAVTTMRATIGRGGAQRGRGRGGGIFSNRTLGASPVKTLKITTSNTSPGGSGRNSSGLFQSAVSGMGGSQWPSYASPPTTRQPHQQMSSVMLTRTVRNPQVKYPPAPPGFMSSYSRMTAGSSGMYSSPTAGTKATPIITRPGIQTRTTRASANYYPESDEEFEDEMDIDDDFPPPPTVLRSSIKSRLDKPSKFKVSVTNLQPSVTSEDITELFADVGDLVSARVFDSGMAEAYYRTKADCLKAIEAYHNRLLDGSPMKVILVEDGIAGGGSSTRASGIISSLKSAGGATMKIPKSTPNPNIKIHPDISAIHKVLFQPSSSSNSTKMLFNKGT